MKINKYWILDLCLTPREDYRFVKANKAQYDSVSIYHEPNDKYFRPIVLGDKSLMSGTSWYPRKFLRGLKKCLSVMDGNFPTREFERYNIYYISKNKVDWGCRTFTRKQVNELIEIVKWHYDI